MNNSSRRAGLLGRFVKAQDGSVLPFFALTVILLLGLGALVYDIGRLLAAATDFQSFADHAALTAAGELDGNAGAQARATSAVTLLIQDEEYFSQQGIAAGGQLLDINDVSLRFLNDLPADDSAPIGNGFNATSDADARYVEVTINPQTISFQLIGALQALTGNPTLANLTIAPQAVAGYTQFACDITPLMICLPNGMTSTQAEAYLPARMIHLKAQSFWGPGAFGLLDANFDPDGPCGTPNQGANFYRCAVAAEQSITRCFARRGVDIRPGQANGPTQSGFNARFDIYTTNLNSKKNDPAFRPAPNVVKGIIKAGGGGGSCISNNFDPSPDTVPLPNDDCFALGTCDHGNRYGEDTDWGVTEPVADGRDAYVAMNHNGVDPAPAATTRYDFYVTEINNAGAPANPILPQMPPKAETGRNQCSSNMSSDSNRRVLTVAAIDCSTLPPGNASGVPVVDFYRLFITRVKGDPDPADLWVEVIEKVDPFGAGGGNFRDHIQLYR
jgi:hypothetical protein